MVESALCGTVSVALREGPLGEARARAPAGAGAVLLFDGVVRGWESGRRLAGLCYEVYSPLTERELERLARLVVQRHALSSIEVLHSFGEVPVGGISFRLVVSAPHRHPALRALQEYVDAMKEQAPIWKVPVWAIDDAGDSAGEAGGDA